MATQQVEQAEELLNLLVESPWLCVVLTPDGTVKVFSRSMTPEHLARIKQSLAEAMEEKTWP